MALHSRSEDAVGTMYSNCEIPPTLGAAHGDHSVQCFCPGMFWKWPGTQSLQSRSEVGVLVLVSAVPGSQCGDGHAHSRLLVAVGGVASYWGSPSNARQDSSCVWSVVHVVSVRSHVHRFGAMSVSTTLHTLPVSSAQLSSLHLPFRAVTKACIK